MCFQWIFETLCVMIIMHSYGQRYAIKRLLRGIIYKEEKE